MRVYLFATMLEAGPFVKQSNSRKLMKKPFTVFSHGKDYIVISGIGKSAAAMAAFFAYEQLKAEIIINCGAAGALKKGYSVGDILHPDRIIEIDRMKIPSGKTAQYRLKPPVKSRCTLVTRDIPAIRNDDRESLSREGDIIDMEAAGIAQASLLLKKDFYCIKIITDTPEKNVNIIISVRKQAHVLAEYMLHQEL